MASDIGKKFPPNFVFSAQTCLELLPQLSKEQLEFEYQHFKTVGCIKRASSRLSLTEVDPQVEIRTILESVNHNQYVDHLAKLNNTLSLMFDRLNTAEREMAALVSPSATATASTAPPPPPTTPEVTYDNHVFHFSDNASADFADLSVKGIREDLDFDIVGSGGRKLDFRGPSDYTYGRTQHKARPYGDSKTVATIFERLASIDPNITRDRYTLLATYYRDGAVSIPEHHDDEPEIVPGSLIYTISVGAERTVRLVNKVGLIEERTIKLPHGSVHVMSADSQSVWAHAIDPEPSVSEERVSFTLRQLDPKITRPEKAAVPEIRPAKPVLPSMAKGSHHRVLFLTDSVLSSTPVHLLNRVPNHRVIKKVNYELASLFGFEPEFAYSSMVVIACGVNDLSRYGKRAHVLADLIAARLSSCLNKHRSTTFVFMSILETSRGWLNCEIREFNRIMFELSERHTNLSFLDSQQVLYSNFPSADKVLESRKEFGGNGIHLTLGAKREITWELARVLRFLAHRRLELGPSTELRNWTWNLRPSFQAIFERSQGGRSPGRTQ